MEDFGNERREWLKSFLELPNGIPDSDTFRRVFERINPSALSKALYSWRGTERKKRGAVAIDTMWCQSGIAKKSSDKKADYCLALKGNQTSLHDDVKLYFENLPAEQYLATREKGHGRIERR